MNEGFVPGHSVDVLLTIRKLFTCKYMIVMSIFYNRIIIVCILLLRVNDILY